jgi:CTP synthase (UTP-ammonia lyase)
MNPVSVGIIGDFDGRSSHIATNEAVRHCAERLSIDAEAIWLPTGSLEGDIEESLYNFDAFWGAPGSPYKSFKGAVNAIRYARENNRLFLGTCGGFQYAVLEYAINVLGIKDARHEEIDPDARTLVITALACSLKAQVQSIYLKEGSLAREIYGSDVIEERYNCSYGLSPEFRDAFEESGFVASGTNGNGDVRILELPKNQFFVATLFQPQLSSSHENPHRLISRYLLEAKKFCDMKRQ